MIWTDRSASDIAEKITRLGNPISVHIAEQLLDEFDFHRRRAQKYVCMKACPDRDEQFVNIARLTQEYLDSGDPILSMDSKKRELIGNFCRGGALLTRGTPLPFDHDYPRFAEGVVIPQGLYDPRLNRGYLHLGTSCDTSEFACHCLKDWWRRFGREQYPGAKSLLLKCDGGGSKSANTYLFKADLQGVADEVGLEIRVAHYPPYCSKYNPIEHRLFCQVSRVCQGMIFTSVDLVRRLMEKTKTRTGLSVVVDVVQEIYHRGRKLAEDVKDALRIFGDDLLPKLNYRILPRS